MTTSNTITFPDGNMSNFNIDNNDKEILKNEIIEDARVRGFSKAIKKANRELLYDRDFIIKTIKYSNRDFPGILNHIPECYKSDKDAVMAAVRKNGMELSNASRELRDNPAIVNMAIIENKGAIAYASPRIKADKTLLDKDNDLLGKIVEENKKELKDGIKREALRREAGFYFNKMDR